jgi:hypothetical protein
MTETSDLRVFSPDVDDSRVVSVTVGELRRACEEADAMLEVVTVRERTCHWAWMENFISTTEAYECEYAGWGLDCGCFNEDPIDEFDNPDKAPDNGWEFCPYCGARVVEP